VIPLPPCGAPLLSCLLAWTLDFGPCPLFLFLSLSWVLFLNKVWQGFITSFQGQKGKQEAGNTLVSTFVLPAHKMLGVKNISVGCL
jgi:hypothetical protein